MADETLPEKRDWRDTVFLPKTAFPMKAGLPQKEPAILAKWQADDLYAKLREARAGRSKFIFHDGPPYANGDIHIGHVLNKTLKDLAVRTQSLLGKDAPFVPGWDCHGLPIEWKVEEQYRKKKRNKDEVPPAEFRAECRAYAQHWVDVQSGQFQRLGILADWKKPYLTMSFEAEATIVSELTKFAESGQLYRGAKPVMWSPVEKTALAEAEIEYEDVVSTQIDVAFEIVESPIPELVGAHAVVWTTTPWTIPVNQAIAYGDGVDYSLTSLRDHDGRTLGRYLVATDLVSAFQDRVDPSLRGADAPELKGAWSIDRFVHGSDLAGSIARHPMHHLGGFFAKPRPLIPAPHVTTDAGTGLVHMAPDHGEEDFEACKAVGIDPVFAVEGDGRYREDWLWLGGQGSVINTKFNGPEGPILTDLREAGALLSAGDFKHSYPHSWRSKARVIYRCTPQWFVAMDRPLAHLPALSKSEQRWEGEGGNAAIDEEAHAGSPTLRELALQSIADTRFVPDKGRNRIGSMVEGRPDWVLSRQRAWGVPITLFVDRKTGKYLVDPEVNARIVAAVREKGVDAWTAGNAAFLLNGIHDDDGDIVVAARKVNGDWRHPDDFEQVTDILDVWFDSGCTHVFTLESGHWPEQRWPADLYLEGSDQHRGWFQSSLLESCGTRGRAPYDTVLTHGFTMDSKGMKMSKSLGNTVNPLDLMKETGADILRLWVASVDFTEDHRIGKEILAGVSDSYRKIRNTFRYLLGALEGFEEAERITDVSEMPELERYMLALLSKLDADLREAVAAYDFNGYARALGDFCNNDLSAFYFDIRKDCLYCEAYGSVKRRSYRSVLDALFHALVRWFAPVLVFTTEEVWATRYPDAQSVHLEEWPVLPDAADARLLEIWATYRALREQVTAEIEPMRRDKVIGSSLEARVAIGLPDDADRPMLSSDELAELFIVSEVMIDTGRVEHGPAVVAHRVDYKKCGRCWRHLPEVVEDGDLCDRCTEVVA
ncbi:isoleucine--tRNA ligase [Sphingomonas astaxanthinifaciens]|uniref:Isoleucine--tRNA ligase n=1 Tax=Sphingomonas astaxanthinifaciens DSM 22298 TaxID=1123267 RepID=A0ABQ5Z5K6_9SPHN|nr:isoleucine--tRNA ligase [Sphingomonas astaxanthinifaciens]GLR47297.1 isoleucine--tRNA ligase [Sphingomonas astaxanthinifaciens DSM 22298]